MTTESTVPSSMSSPRDVTEDSAIVDVLPRDVTTEHRADVDVNVRQQQDGARRCGVTLSK